jgi:hypothetical protein
MTLTTEMGEWVISGLGELDRFGPVSERPDSPNHQVTNSPFRQ